MSSSKETMTRSRTHGLDRVLLSALVLAVPQNSTREVGVAGTRHLNAVKPAEKIFIEPVQASWSELLRLQASLPESARLVDQVDAAQPLGIEIPPIELGPMPRIGTRTPPSTGGGVLESTSCTGFVAEPPLGPNFLAQDDVPDSTLTVFIPPNTAGAVGPDHLMTMMNNAVQIRTRLGVSITSMDPATFWSPLGGASLAFPRVNYDALHSRYIATVRSGLAVASQVLLLAVSVTDDPTGSWNYYSIDADAADTQSPDWLTQGYNGNWITMTANMFTGATFSGAKMWIADQTTVGGTLGVSVFATGFMSAVHPGAPGSSLMPSRALDSSTADMWLLNTSFTTGGVFLLQPTRISGTPSVPAASAYAGGPFPGTGLTPVTTNWSGTQLTINQVSDLRFISVFSIRQASCVVRNGSLWSVNSGGQPGPSTNAAPTSTGVLWREMDMSLALTSMLVQDGVITAVGTRQAYPSIAVNCAEDVLIGYSRGDVTKNPEAAYVMRLGTDAPSTMGVPKLLRIGDSSYWKNFGVGATAQWGLYSSTAADPNDDITLWTLQEYAALRVGPADDDSRWGTWWGRLGDCEDRPTITDQPDPVFTCVGLPASFMVVATSPHPITYQWRKNGVPILGATTDTYTIPVTVVGDAGTYDVLVCGCGIRTSAGATLSFGGAVVTTHPTSVSAFPGDPASFTVAGTGTGPLTYQWRRNGVPILGATNATYSIASVVKADYGAYDCIIADTCGPATSNVAHLDPGTDGGHHAPKAVILAFTEHPGSLLACLDDTVLLEVATTNVPGRTLAWRKNGVPIAPPETATTLVLTPITLASAGSYDCVATDGTDTVASRASVITVNSPPVITLHPVNQTVPQGSTITFTAEGGGDGDPSYQWQKRPIANGGFVNINGAINATYVKNNAKPQDQGFYRCVVTNHCGSTPTNEARLFVN
jgi:hypothetical protein